MLIRHGVVHDGLGGAGRLDLRIEDGMIAAIAPALSAYRGEEVIDASGMEVFPGFVQPISIWGVNGSMTEIRPSSNDNAENSDPITPQLDAFYAFNGRAASAQQLGAFGLTSCGVAPADTNLFGGTIAAFSVDGLNPYRMCLRRGCGMMASVMPQMKKLYGARQQAPQTRMWIFAQFALQLKKASEYQGKEGTPPDDKLAALKKVTEGELPLFVSCDSAVSAEQIYDIVKEYPRVRLVLVNGFGLTGGEDFIVDHQIPVIVRTPSNPLEKEANTLSLPAIAALARKGVPIAMSGTWTNQLGIREDMLWNGIEMMKVLHDAEAVLPMLTSVPAKLLGLEDRTGSLREGLLADIVLWSDNPLQTYRAKVVRTFQRGRVIYQEGDGMKCM